MFLYKKRKNAYISELEKLCQKLSKTNNYRIFLANSLNVNNGDTKYFKKSSKMYSRIGIKDFISSNDKEFAFVQTLIIIFHELQHKKQNDQINNGTASPEMFYDAISIFENRDYYEQNYKIDLRELDANYVGINNAYEYLLINHPEINAFEMIKRYMMDHSFFSEYTEDIEKLNSIEEINNIFEVMIKSISFKLKTMERCAEDRFFNSILSFWDDTGINPIATLIEATNCSELNVNFLSDKIVGIITRDLNPEYLPLFERNHISIETLDDVMNEIKEYLREDPGLP